MEENKTLIISDEEHQQIRERIKQRMGDGLLDIELTKEQLDNAITDSIGYWKMLNKKTESVFKIWIERYAYALSLETLGIIRSKYKSIPIPNNTDNLVLSTAELFNLASVERSKLESYVP